MADLGTAYVQIVPSARGIKGSISGVLDGEAESAGTSAGSKIGSFAKKAIAAAAIGATFAAGIKMGLDEGAKLQQSYFGGLDTLYGKSADTARKYAREAASAGISMNTYSEQAVSFGAALKNAYGGNTKKAIEAANTAIMDMADNSAKMGTDITSVQDAYQGFAKQNYVMLDNLKLGYGGTKTEMERLLADAEKLSGQKYNIDNLGDVYDAIHVIQQDLGLTGVAASEASTTFSGSFNAMKASAQNFLGSLAIGENVSQSLNQLMTSTSTFFFGNFLPMLGTIIKSLPGAIGTFISQGVPMLLTKISSLISSLANSITAKANSLTGSKVSQWASSSIPKFLAAAGKMIGKFAVGLIQNIPKIAVALAKIGASIIKGLGAALWNKVKSQAAHLVSSMLSSIIAKFHSFKAKAAAIWNKVKEAITKPIQAAKDKVKGIIDKIKGFFPIKVGRILGSIKLPHFSLSGSFSLKNKTVPHLSVSWYAKGGIATGPTLAGVGEAGNEAIVPLDSFWKRLDQMSENMGGNTFNVTLNANGSENPEQYAQRFARELRRQVRMGTV